LIVFKLQAKPGDGLGLTLVIVPSASAENGPSVKSIAKTAKDRRAIMAPSLIAIEADRE